MRLCRKMYLALCMIKGICEPSVVQNKYTATLIIQTLTTPVKCIRKNNARVCLNVHPQSKRGSQNVTLIMVVIIYVYMSVTCTSTKWI